MRRSWSADRQLQPAIAAPLPVALPTSTVAGCTPVTVVKSSTVNWWSGVDSTMSWPYAVRMSTGGRLSASAPGVLEAAVAAVPGELHGARLIAYVVGQADPAVMRATVADGLGSAAVPTVVTVPDLPRLPGGKVDLPSLMAEASQRPEGR